MSADLGDESLRMLSIIKGLEYRSDLHELLVNLAKESQSCTHNLLSSAELIRVPYAACESMKGMLGVGDIRECKQLTQYRQKLLNAIKS